MNTHSSTVSSTLTHSNPANAEENDAGKPAPRLPHEQDESSDSQTSGPRRVIEQARRDIESGQEDTDLRSTRGVRQRPLGK